MILGRVNARLEAKLQLKVLGPTGAKIDVDAIIDTGFTGSLSMPIAAVAKLGLVKRSGGAALLADGSACNFDAYAAELEWSGTKRSVVVSAVGHEVLAGMVLLAGHKLMVEVEDGGAVQVQSLRP